MFRRCTTYVVMCVLIVLAGIASVGAQQFTGSVRGLVRDANGVIPGVTVTLVNEATNISREVTTNDVGVDVPPLPSSLERLATLTVGLSLSAIEPVCEVPPLIA